MTSLEKCLEKYKNDGLIERAAVRVGMGDRVLFEQYLDTDENTLFDMASLSKLIGTTMAALRMIDIGKLRLDNTMGDFFDDCHGKEKTSVHQLMT
ncbi:MAG: serine hydrolase, partial [Clostridia bacterium]|nr:serine hydrolase [Clostridia bacterium]